MIIDINKTSPADNPSYSHFSILVDDIKEAHRRLESKRYWVDGPVYEEYIKRHIVMVCGSNGFLVQMVQQE